MEARVLEAEARTMRSAGERWVAIMHHISAGKCDMVSKVQFSTLARVSGKSEKIKNQDFKGVKMNKYGWMRKFNRWVVDYSKGRGALYPRWAHVKKPLAAFGAGNNWLITSINDVETIHSFLASVPSCEIYGHSVGTPDTWPFPDRPSPPICLSILTSCQLGVGLFPLPRRCNPTFY